jgi:hypothetical protein
MNSVGLGNPCCDCQWQFTKEALWVYD